MNSTTDRLVTRRDWLTGAAALAGTLLIGHADARAATLVRAAAPEDALLRYRLARVRDAAIRKQHERALTKLNAASRRLAIAWDAATAEDKTKLAREAEAALGLAPPDGLPAGLDAERIPFAVPKRETLELPYAKIEGVDPRRLSLDVYAPVAGEKRPVVIWWHGGGFVGGDKSHPLLSVAKPDFFVARGCAFVAANYRLAPQHKFPAPAEDAAAALAYVRREIAKHGGDPERIFLIGDSAGGQLVSILSTNDSLLKKHGETLAAIRGTVVLDIGSFDVPMVMDRLGANAPKQYHDAFDSDRDDWIAASPMLHVAAGKSIPPMLLCYVSGREHHRQENERFAAKLKECGGRAEVVEVKDRDHHTLAYNVGTLDDPTTEKIMAFIDSPRGE